MQHVEQVIPRIRQLTLELLDGDPSKLSRACLYHALATQMVTGAKIVAGSYSWQFTGQDDGINPTHFSCLFDDLAQAQTNAILSNPHLIPHLPNFPEMHCWNEMDGKVLDISIMHISKFAQEASGFKFEHLMMPPPYLFDNPTHPEQRWVYEEHPLASELARQSAQVFLNKRSARKVINF